MMTSEMKSLVDLLHEGGYTLVVANNGEVRTFHQRGVADLMDLLVNDPQFLQGARIADKVVGKAAAALMIKGGVAGFHADTLSQPALDLLEREGRVQFEYTQLVPHIENRKKDGWCPMEKLCYPKDSIEDMFVSMREFIENMKHAESK